MAIEFKEHDGNLVVEVLENLLADDANLIEAAVARLPGEATVEVDLHRARQKQMLALWLLVQAARHAPGRYRFTGLTMADARFLTHVGAEDLAAEAH